MRTSFSAVAVSTLFVLTQAFSSAALSAQVDSAELTQMTADAQQKGLTPVVVHLAPVSFSDMRSGIDLVKARMAALAGRLLAELGQEASTAGRWENGIGQMGVNVTPAGLKLLQNSGNAVSFNPGQPWYARTALSVPDGRLQAIERQLLSQGHADVQVVLNLDGLDFDIKSNGEVLYRSTGQAVAATIEQANRLLNQFSGAQAIGKEAVMGRFAAMLGQSSMLVLRPEFTLRVNREGLEILAASNDVRSLQPVGYRDPRPLIFDTDVIPMAIQKGWVEVIVTIRTPLSSGVLSRASQAAEAQSNKRALAAVLAAAGVRRSMQDLSRLGAMVGYMNATELRALRANADARLLSVQLNKPIAAAQLTTSTVSSNFPSAWAAGYRGAGQNIVVMDTGVQSNHMFLQGANGQSKVVYEACFGTNILINNVSYESNCPGQLGTTGDSPPGIVGSAMPRVNCVPSNSPSSSDCHHGTHVAGIATGRHSPVFFPGFQGVANEANLIAIQVFSFDKNRSASPIAFDADIAAAMQAIADAVDDSTTSNPYTVNLSLGSKLLYESACGTVSSTVTNAVKKLLKAGVPVIAATGNSASRKGISWPACIPGVIKVGSVENNTSGTTISAFTNLADPEKFFGDFFWMAPGGGGITSVTSSANGGTQNTMSMSGTSQAAPHVAGLYAMVKSAIPGISVNDVSKWIEANASAVLPAVNVDGNRVVFRRIRVPKL